MSRSSRPPGVRAGLLRADVLHAASQRVDDRRHRLHQRDQAGHGDGAGAHRADVAFPHLPRRHVANRNGAGIERVGEPFAEELDRRHQHQPREHAAGEDRAGDPRTDDVADAEILAGDLGAEGRAGQPRRLVERPLLPHLRGGHQERVGAAQAEAPEHAAGERPALFARHQHVGAGGPFRIQQVAVLLHDQLPAQRNHEQHADPAADQRQHEDARVLEGKAHEDQRRQREDRAGGDRFTRRPRRLDDVVLEDGRLAERAQQADAEDGDGDRRRNGQAGAQADVDRDRAEDDPEDRAEEHGLERELRHVRRLGNVRPKLAQGRRRIPRRVRRFNVRCLRHARPPSNELRQLPFWRMNLPHSPSGPAVRKSAHLSSRRRARYDARGGKPVVMRSMARGIGSSLWLVGIAAGLVAAGAMTLSSAQGNSKWWWDNLAGPDSSNFVDLDQIKKSNVNQLEVAWFYPYATPGFNPIVVDDVMYVLGRGTARSSRSMRRPARKSGSTRASPASPAAASTTGRARTARTSGCCSRSTASCRRSTPRPASRS